MSTPCSEVPTGEEHADPPALLSKEDGGETLPLPPPTSSSSSSSPKQDLLAHKASNPNDGKQTQTPDERADTALSHQERPSPSTHLRDVATGRQLSPLPPFMPRHSRASGHGSLEAAGIRHFGRKPLSPRSYAARKGAGMESLSTLSLDSEQTRAAAEQRRERAVRNQQQQEQRSSTSIEGQPFRRWGPLISPHMVHRLRESYVPGTLPTNTEDPPASAGSRPESPPSSLQLPKVQSQDSMEVDAKAEEKVDSLPPRVAAEEAYLKRKPDEEDRDSPFAFSVPPSSFDDRLGDATQHVGQRMRQQQQRSLTPVGMDRPAAYRSQYGLDRNVDMSQRESELVMSQGKHSALAGTLIPQRKSCDRCFKMKTKCSRAAPGAPGDAPCDGCIRRGFGDSCHTSRPDNQFPRISLSKRQRRESSLPDFNDASASDASVYLHPSAMTKGDSEWRLKLIDNSPRRNEDYQHERATAHNSSYAPYAPLERSVRSQDERSLRPGEHTWQSPPTLDRPLRQVSGSGGARDGQLGDGQGARHRFGGPHRAPMSDLRGNGSLQDFDASQTERNIRTPVVPSSSSLAGVDDAQGRLAPSQGPAGGGGGSSRSTIAAVGVSSSQQAMQNFPMQLLPKGIGIPALEYFDQLIAPFLPLPLLASKLLREQFEAYTKPGRNNILEIVMAIGLQLQGALLSCSDRGQASIVEGRIFKDFLRADGKKHLSDASEGMTIDTVKNWIEPARHRNRAKDIVKLVCMRRCLKCGLDYDDVLENVLLAYFHLIRGDSSSVYMLTGDAQRQVTLLQTQSNNVRESDAWNEAGIETLRSIVQSLNLLQPLALYSEGATEGVREQGVAAAPAQGDDISMMSKLAAVAKSIKRGKERENVEDEVDKQIKAIQDSLPPHMQFWLHDQRIHSLSFKSVTDEKWVSDMVTRGSNTIAPLFRMRGVMITNYLRIVARQHHCIRALANLVAGNTEEGESDTTTEDTLPLDRDDARLVPIQQLLEISSAMLASVHLALTIFPHLTSLAQAFAGEMSAAFWSFIVCHLILGGEEGRKTGEQETVLDKIEDCLSIILANLTSSKEKESWPFASSLNLAKKAIAGLRASDKTAADLLALFVRFSSASPQAMSRMLQGDPWAAVQIGRGLHSHIEAAKQKP